MNKENLIKNISNCFKTDTYSIENLINKESFGSYEAKQIEKAFSYKKWEKLDQKLLIANKSALGFLSDEAFIYFLPAYMKLLILEFEAADVIVDTLLEKLLLPTEADMQLRYIEYKMEENKIADLDDFYQKEIKRIEDKIHDFISMTTLLNLEQSKTVLLFLIYIKDTYSGFFIDDILDKVINRFWFQFK